MKTQKKSKIILIIFIFLNLFLWGQILIGRETEASFIMLDVGQGDSSLLIFESGATIMTDAGPSRETTRALDKVNLPRSKHIDLAVITHPELDHYGGFSDVLDHYSIGGFIVNGRVPDGESLVWDDLISKIKARNIPMIVVSEGDIVRHGENTIYILSPNPIFRESGAMNDTGIVGHVFMSSSSILLTADTGSDVENYLMRQYDLRSDILKVGHHGSKYSSSKQFLEVVRSKIAVIGVGEENRYGHPTEEVLGRLSAVMGKNIFRTDRNGTIRIKFQEGRAQVVMGQ